MRNHRKNQKLPNSLLSEDDVKNLIENAKNDRFRAIIRRIVFVIAVFSDGII